MSERQAIDAINSVAAPFIYVLLVVLTFAMLVRVIRHLRSRHRTPLLLARDFALFAALLVLIGGAQFARFTGTKLGEQLWWVVLTDALSISVLVLWCAVEFAVVGRRGDDES